MKKMYIAVLEGVPDFMVPTLVAHAVLGAHLFFEFQGDTNVDVGDNVVYREWLENSFRKVVLKVNHKEFNKIRDTMICYQAHENTTLNGEKSCLVVLPVESDAVPNVLKFAKMWKPSQGE